MNITVQFSYHAHIEYRKCVKSWLSLYNHGDGTHHKNAYQHTQVICNYTDEPVLAWACDSSNSNHTYCDRTNMTIVHIIQDNGRYHPNTYQHTHVICNYFSVLFVCVYKHSKGAIMGKTVINRVSCEEQWRLTNVSRSCCMRHPRGDSAARAGARLRAATRAVTHGARAAWQTHLHRHSAARQPIICRIPNVWANPAHMLRRNFHKKRWSLFSLRTNRFCKFAKQLSWICSFCKYTVYPSDS